LKYWQLGNEVSGPWEIGHYTPHEYAMQAREWGKVPRRLDPGIKLLTIGGEADDDGKWAWEVLPEVAPDVDYVTCYTYRRRRAGGRLGGREDAFLAALPVALQAFAALLGQR